MADRIWLHLSEVVHVWNLWFYLTRRPHFRHEFWRLLGCARLLGVHTSESSRATTNWVPHSQIDVHAINLHSIAGVNPCVQNVGRKLSAEPSRSCVQNVGRKLSSEPSRFQCNSTIQNTRHPIPKITVTS